MDKVILSKGKVIENREVAPDVFLLRVEGEYSALPGQFYMLRAWELDPPLFRPMSVFDLGPSAISFLYAVRGRGTRLLSRLSPGDGLTLLGPLGNGWPRAEGRVALVGGGMGIAPLLFTAKAFGGVDVYLGFRGRPYLLEEFRNVAAHIRVASESGGGWEKGPVTKLFSPRGYAACYACGPSALLKALSEKCQKEGVPLFVSLEERMACGLGACLGCTIPTVQGPKRVCQDGPVFCAEEVLWDG